MYSQMADTICRYPQVLCRVEHLEIHSVSAVTTFCLNCKHTELVLLSMQAILDLQQQKVEATQVAEDWKASSETAWRRFASLEAECSKVRGQLQTKRSEVDDLQQLSEQQSEVSACD